MAVRSTSVRTIDLNADAGEGDDERPMGDDAALIPLVSSVNVACGGHAGDRTTMARTVALALRAGVAIGAHPSYPDRDGFGRRPMAIEPAVLAASLADQVGALVAVATAAGTRVRHLKPHGALYHRAAADATIADRKSTRLNSSH